MSSGAEGRTAGKVWEEADIFECFVQCSRERRWPTIRLFILNYTSPLNHFPDANVKRLCHMVHQL